ncbi:MAG TPA: isocitrate lyase/phosphoenolpyruvate mutase family protein, partial [Chitinophagaceae bacterium]|nr:isocitrate lyase/phosphoenolpyruvate mutase family protein [Chitinophagaceae bacterium]
MTQQEKAMQFYNLHYSGELLVLPNVWDCLGAMLLENIGYSAVATASASIAYTNGYDDGENIPFDDLLILLKKIADSVNLPVTADIESGFAENDIQLEKNIRRIIETGIVGINIEDSDKKTKTLLPIAIQSDRIRLIKRVSNEMGVSLFI